MHVKKGDNITVIAGKDKGKKGAIIRSIPSKDMVIVSGINMRKRHQKARKQGGKGQILEIAAPLHVSNVKKS